MTDSAASAAAAPLLTGTVSLCDASPRPEHSRICCCVDTTATGFMSEAKSMCPMAQLDCKGGTSWDPERNTCWDTTNCGRGRWVIAPFVCPALALPQVTRAHSLAAST